MYHISIISSSVRTGRNSHRLALFFQHFIEENNFGLVEIIDLNKYQFPIFNERLKYQPHPSSPLIEFAEKFKSSDCIIIVTPEYNGGYPASLKNVIDVLEDEWYKKPVAIATASSGNFGGSQAIISLQFSLWKLQAIVVPAHFPMPNVQKAFDEEGKAVDKEDMNKNAKAFIGELLWCLEAKHKMTLQEQLLV
jgi:NAD(P)H-dependent FMN reductase